MTKFSLHHCLLHVLLLLLLLTQTLALATTPPQPPLRRSYLITGANKGQGLALCRRILSEYDDTHVFLCSRDVEKGHLAKSSLLSSLRDPSHPFDESRIDVLPLDVTSQSSVDAAASRVQSILTSHPHSLKFTGVVSNAGILWGYPLPQLLDVCAIGVKRVLDAFAPLLLDDGGATIVVVTSGLSPLLMSYARPSHRDALLRDTSTWEGTILPLLNQCLAAYASSSSLSTRIEAFDSLGFPGGPFAEAAPDFHMYGLAKMFGDAYMKVVAREHPTVKVASVDPGLVYTDLILRMPKYRGKERGETTAASPEEGVEGAMRLLFGGEEVWGREGEGRGKLFAMDKERKGVVFSEIDRMPQKQ